MAKLDRRVGDEGLQVVLAELGIEPQDIARVGLLDGELGDRTPLGVVGVEQLRPRVPPSTRASFQARLCASATPVLPPKPPVGGIAWAASPARKIRPSWKRSAHSARGVPLLHVLDLDRQIRRPERLADVLDAAVVAHVGPDIPVPRTRPARRSC